MVNFLVKVIFKGLLWNSNVLLGKMQQFESFFSAPIGFLCTIDSDFNFLTFEVHKSFFYLRFYLEVLFMYSFYLQVVRYHSLVIDADTLPKELVPVAWTTSVRLLLYLETSKNLN